MIEKRRDFLRMALGVSAAPAILSNRRADGSEQSGVRRPIVSTGSRIKSIETFTSGALSIVRVRTDSGQEGYGQIAPFKADISATVLHRMVAPQALGKDPADLDGISDRCVEANYKFPWSFVCRALAGLDTALWDIHGKTAGKSVCELLGGKPRPFPVYGSSMRRDIKPADEAARLVRLRDAQGFRAFKDPDRQRVRPRRGPVARTYGRVGSDGPQSDRQTMFACSSTAIAATRPAKAIEVGKLLADRQGLPLRGALPLLGAGVDRPGRRRPGCACRRRRAG